MRIDSPGNYLREDELSLLNRELRFDGARVLELGCGRAWFTRLLANECGVASIVATEVDRVQHDRNLLIRDLPNVEFRYGGAEAIDLADSSVDIVLMRKSLHHVAVGAMDRAMSEIARVLRPGGMAAIVEPIYAGALNEILSLFHDEREVREAAFAAICRAVEDARLDLVRQCFIETEVRYADFGDFEDRMIRVTHTEHRLSADLYQRVRERFLERMGPDGARFGTPTRVDLLRRPRVAG